MPTSRATASQSSSFAARYPCVADAIRNAAAMRQRMSRSLNPVVRRFKNAEAAYGLFRTRSVVRLCPFCHNRTFSEGGSRVKSILRGAKVLKLSLDGGLFPGSDWGGGRGEDRQPLRFIAVRAGAQPDIVLKSTWWRLSMRLGFSVRLTTVHA